MLSDNQCWELIKNANWKSDHNYERIKSFFKSQLSSEDFNVLKEFVRNKRITLAEKFHEDWLSDPGIEVSDDGWWDLTADVVGRGEEFYNNVTAEKLVMMAARNDYEENFEYSVN